MIIKSHIRGGYRQAADYLKEFGKNEEIRLVEISDPDARNLDEAFHNMWTVASNTRCRKPLHHISINPYKDERLTDKQVLKIVARCEEKYGYKPGDHQRVIVEHVLDGRQHFHVMWCRVSLTTGKPVWPGMHWNKSKQAAREMEKELGLKRPMPRRIKRLWTALQRAGRSSRYFGRYQALKAAGAFRTRPLSLPVSARHRPATKPASSRPPNFYQSVKQRRRRKRGGNIPDSEKLLFRRPEWDTAELLAWAWENNRADILAQFGIYVDFEP